VLQIKKISELRKILKPRRQDSKIIGLVPTMGAFHAGHLSLMKRAREECDQVVVSLFVNPTQFAPGEDYAKYPRDFASDSRRAQAAGVDILFIPDEDELYPRKLLTRVEVDEITDCLCGPARPGHFQGVALIVAKLFNIVQPDRAYFGRKDWQQLKVIERMAADLNIPVKIVPMPIIRDKDGLALSSRNKYMTASQREQALIIPKALKAAVEMIKNGERHPAKVSRFVEEMIAKSGGVELEYFSIRRPDDLAELNLIESDVLLAAAARTGKTRLIDNIYVKVNDDV